MITERIASKIDENGGGDFVFYENPKKSFSHPYIHHVQVFWKYPLSRFDGSDSVGDTSSTASEDEHFRHGPHDILLRNMRAKDRDDQ